MKDKRPSVRITQGVYDRLTRLKRQLGLSYTDTIQHLLNHFPEYTEQQRLILKAFTLTATLFDRLLQVYPDLRADMKDDLTELWACIDKIKANWATKLRTPQTNPEETGNHERTATATATDEGSNGSE